MKTPWWFLHKTPIAFLLWPVSIIYRVVARGVYMVRKFGAYNSRRPIICVGNIFAGGVGKTPIVRAIATYLDAPIVMRGYKKSDKTHGAGDEAMMLARDGLVVHTGNRRANISLLDKQDTNMPIIMDDGFQNPTIKKTLSILVFDEKLGFGNGFILPAGPLREGRRAVRRADAVIVIQNAVPGKRRKMKFPAGVPVFYAKNQTISPYDEGTPLVAFAGIGYPKKFFSSLKNVVARRAFADHWQYTDMDLEKLTALARKKKAKLITTEKDWVRLPESLRDEIKYAKLVTVIDTEFWNWIKEKIEHGNTKKAS